MSRDFRLPDLGEGLTEAEVLQWLVQPGDVVTVDQPVVEVETAKASVEVPVPWAGVVLAVHGAPGDVVAVGAPLITIGAEGEGFREPGAVTAAQGRAEGAAEEGSGKVLIGYGTGGGSARRRGVRHRASRPAEALPPTAEEVAPPPARAGLPATATEDPSRAEPPARAAATAAPPRRRNPVVSPLVRRLAKDKGVDVHALTGSGPDGLVLRRDVEAAAAPDTAAAVPAAAASGERRVRLGAAHRRMAESLSRSRREIPEATVWVDVDATRLVEARRALRDRGEPVGLLALLARFVVAGLRRYPALGGTLDLERGELVLRDEVHLGFAAQTPTGLVVPVVRDAHALPTRQLGERIGELTAKARDGKLAPADMVGGTFTVNNYGVFGVDGSAAIINAPEVAILGMGRLLDRAWVVDGSLAVRTVTELTLAFDHRVCDGGTAGGFLRFVADCVEEPLAALLEV